MSRCIALLLLFVSGATLAFAQQTPADGAAGAPATGKKTTAYLIPVHEQIAKPTLYIIRRGLKEAIENKADVVVLDMKTPGGELGVTFEIMEALAKFPGTTITYVNKEAISAGAFISAVTHEIHFAPDGVIGAAAPVLSTGGDIDATMKQKVVSYLKARVRAISEGKGDYRGQVISAMIDSEIELKIGEKVIKPKGELLSLTATEANEKYGDPARPLLAAGIAKDVDDLLAQKYGAGNFEVRRFKVTWSESLAQYLTALSPILMGLGMLLLFVEFKTPGFGLPGIAGGVLLAIVFFGHFIAGLSGHEPAIAFAIGLLLVAVELIFFPGVVLPALLGVALMLGSLIWAMADLWPNQPIEFTGDVFVRPITNLGIALVITVALGAALIRYLPKSWFWDRLILAAEINANSQTGAIPAAATRDPLIGLAGVAVTGMYPSGEVEIDGRRYQAQIDLGHIVAGTPIVVKDRTAFGLLVERRADV
jgi:membrane-bound serine protease (ClpP class)